MSEQPVALVSGSNRGLGRAVAESFLEKGYVVCGCSRSESPWASAKYNHAIVNVAHPVAASNWIKHAVARFGRVDVLVNVAGIHTSAPLAISSIEAANAVMCTNYLGTLVTCREAVRAMLPRRSGRIVNISSIAAHLHMPGAGAYAASKAAIVELSKVLAAEVAAAGITCNVVAVSLVETDMTAGFSESATRAVMDRLVIKRWASHADVCNAVAFFTSPDAAYVTGQVLCLGFIS